MKRILIVEDDTTYSLMLKTWLKKKEFEVETAGNIKDAQKILNNYHIDLILSDLRLPDHDGISLLEWMNIKKNPIPLIIMTGYAEIQTAVQAMKLGAKDYVSKPINPDEHTAAPKKYFSKGKQNKSYYPSRIFRRGK